jgi:hypothetical protein
MARRRKRSASDGADSKAIPPSDLRPPRDQFPSDEEWQRVCHQADALDEDLRKIEEQQREILEKLHLPTDVTELKAVLLATGLIARMPLPPKYKRGWASLQALATEIPKIRQYAKEGNAYLAARWALKVARGGEVGFFAAHGVRAEHQAKQMRQKPKYARGILAFIKERVSQDPRLTPKRLLEALPDAHGDTGVVTVHGDDGRPYEVYRSGRLLVEEDDKTGRSRAVGLRTLETYFERAREEISRGCAKTAG